MRIILKITVVLLMVFLNSSPGAVNIVYTGKRPVNDRQLQNLANRISNEQELIDSLCLALQEEGYLNASVSQEHKDIVIDANEQFQLD